MRRRLFAICAVTAGAALAAAPAAGPAAAPRKKTVRVFDNYYAPLKLTVARGTTIVWEWPELAGDVHDVKLGKGPKGARKFQSEVAAAAYAYKRKLTVPGTYAIVCTLHDEMTMTIRVTKR